MESLFLVESPLQLLNAIEAKAHFQDEVNTLVIRLTGNDYGNTQMGALLGQSQWNEVLVHRYARKKDLLKSLLLLKKLRRRGRNYRRIFVGDIRDHWMKLFLENLVCQEAFLLDDGVGTVLLQEHWRSGQRHDGRTDVALLKKFLLRAMGVAEYREERHIIDLFTMYDLTPRPGQRIVRNDLAYSKGMVTKEFVEAEETVFFVGSNLSEFGVVSEEFCLGALKRVKEHYGDLKVVYCPHRRESDTKCRKIQSDCGMEVRRLANMIEIDFILNKIRPRRIASFYSAALLTLQMIFPSANVDAFFIPPKEISPRYREDVGLVYRFFEGHMNLVRLLPDDDGEASAGDASIG